MMPLLETALDTPAVNLRLAFCAPRDTLLPPVVAAKIRGALLANLRRLSEGRTGALADRYRAAADTFRAVKREVTLTEGRKPHPLHCPHFVLGVPWQPWPVGPQEPFIIEALLLGEAAGLWDAWVQGAHALELDIAGVELALVEAWLGGAHDGAPAMDFAHDPAAAVGVLGEVLGPPPEGVGAVRLHMLTPTAWDRSCHTAPQPGPGLAPGKLIWSGFQRLSMVAGVNAAVPEAGIAPTAAEQELRDAILPSQARLTSPALHAVQAWRSSGRNEREPMRYGGLVGHVDVRPSSGRPARLGLPQDLVELLWALQVTHVGADVVFGCGRVRVEVIE